MTPQEITALINVAGTLLPEILALFRTRHPDAASLTDAELTRALAVAAAETIAVDEQWKRTHASAADLGFVTGSTGE